MIEVKVYSAFGLIFSDEFKSSGDLIGFANQSASAGSGHQLNGDTESRAGHSIDKVMRAAIGDFKSVLRPFPAAASLDAADNGACASANYSVAQCVNMDRSMCVSGENEFITGDNIINDYLGIAKPAGIIFFKKR